jgi:hypothetical protein
LILFVNRYYFIFQWLGFVVTFAVSWIMSAVFFLGAPYLLKPDSPAQEPKPEDAGEKIAIKQKFKSMFSKVWKILSRPTFIFLVSFFFKINFLVDSNIQKKLLAPNFLFLLLLGFGAQL